MIAAWFHSGYATRYQSEITMADNEIDINKVIQGDCLDVMKRLPDNFVDTIITDPPYGLTNRTPDVMRCIDCKRVLGGRDGNPVNCPKCGGKISHQRSQQKRGFMGKEWDNGDVAFNPEIWREALRVAKPGGTLMAFGGTRTFHRLTCAIEDAGWEIRDSISYFSDGTQQEQALMASLDEEQLAAYLELHYPNMGMDWVYGSGFPKSTSVSKMIDKAAVVDCPNCGGVGYVMPDVSESGNPDYVLYSVEGIIATQIKCDDCGGTGKVKGAEAYGVGAAVGDVDTALVPAHFKEPYHVVVV